MLKTIVPVLLVMMAAAPACDRGKGMSSSSSPSMTPASGTNANAMTNQDAEQLADARCDREQRCGEIGADKDYKDREHCMTTERKDARDELGKCRRGLDRNGLDQCIQELNQQDCEGLTEKPREVMACDDLCQD